MTRAAQGIQRIYLTLTLCNTLAASFIWGINTLFLLDAGLTNTEAFGANAFFTVGQVLFEVPTGIVADTLGRKISFVLGAFTLMATTLLYFWLWQISAPFWMWAVTSALLGLGFTFFSGATEAWLVDALHATGFKGNLESPFAKGQIVGGVAMLTGSVAGGVIAQTTNLGVPYIIRSVILALTFVVALVFMKDIGFTPQRGGRVFSRMKNIFSASITHGLKNRPVRWIMLAAPFSFGVSFYAFYAMQPYLLELYGNERAYGVAGLAAAIIAGAQIAGGFAVRFVRRYFTNRTSVLLTAVILNTIILVGIGLTSNFWVAIILLVMWGLIFSASGPVQQAYLNGLIPSQQRATVLSFASLMGSSGGVVIQPALGKVADAWSYSISYIVGGGFQLLAAPFIALARREKPKSDPIK